MKKTSTLFAILLLFLLTRLNASAATVVIEGVPAYAWYHGCGPTAAASILGYYDLNGYDSLFDASGWEEVSLTSNVADEISSPEHNSTYDSNLDLPNVDPSDTSIADFFHTSEGDLGYGSSYLHYAADAFEGYAAFRGYNDWNAYNDRYSASMWNEVVSEIDAGRPMMFLIDTDENGVTDHFVPVFGYDDEKYRYGFYTTWSEDEIIHWEYFEEMGTEIPWGIGYATYIRPGAADPVPIPSTAILLGLGLIGLACASWNRTHRWT